MLLHVLLCAVAKELAGKQFEIYLKDKNGKHLFLTSTGEQTFGWMSKDNHSNQSNNVFTINIWQNDINNDKGQVQNPTLDPQYWGINDKGLYCGENMPKDKIKPYAPDMIPKDCIDEKPLLYFPNLTKLMDLGVFPGLKSCNDVYRPLKDEKNENDTGQKIVDPEKWKEPGKHKLSNLVKSNFIGKLFGKKKKTDKDDAKDKKDTEDKKESESSDSSNSSESSKDKDLKDSEDVLYQIEFKSQYLGDNHEQGVKLYESINSDEIKWKIVRKKSEIYEIKLGDLCLGMEKKVKIEKKVPVVLGNCQKIAHDIYFKEIKGDKQKNKDIDKKEK